METQQELDYRRVASAISFFKENHKLQPKLEDVAEHVNLSPFHFQRMFQNWAGVTPKQFLQYLSAEYAKDILKNTGASLFDTAYETGLSGTSRLHDLFVKVEGMTPGEFKNGGESLKINYTFADSPFGKMLVASTSKGICHMTFVDEDEEKTFQNLVWIFPNATYSRSLDMAQQNALRVFSRDWSKLDEIKLHLKGTEFQIKVWETLLKVPAGGLTTYGDLAHSSGYKGASSSVRTALVSNPVAFLIPCHRVIKSNGELGQYIRKNAIIGWEAALQATG
ncbi:AraC family transcriptional regulator of adaptative response/methylated-DNA-[protein]-cysteine methyltransferase [Mucilaginibacter frigoritolerans]|uniref:AraC family transcriptional regulator of adaptative response/methylated-DNA-[protein]-cysteine methyltransferase n=1 Tax=Mucilaginibacter frigoritolerans TaxID=652788 RepID=A0A562UBN9_9SPHI|nr:methylated-DNA--[protein]-cysteine S-methyltransferase [Mucilaginibacter frigoritolerans]TWJ03176.1 AraC family transcriptional regulator of adaptative response/methylated-DNA-[protein]-cysteine methyltransferase [Mucilaginibacter frigoritolerans]